MHGKIHVTFRLTYLLNDKSYNTCFLTVCFFRLWLILKVEGELQNVIENSTNFIKKNLHLPKFVKALYNDAFFVQIVKNPYHDFLLQTLQRRHAWPILQHDNKVRQQKVKNGHSKSQEKYVRNKKEATH